LPEPDGPRMRTPERPRIRQQAWIVGCRSVMCLRRAGAHGSGRR
jgi:hypothetical protein